MIDSGAAAPDVELETPDGDAVRLGDEFRTGPTLLVFFKHDCGACRVAVPRVPRFAESYEGLRVWAISQDDPATTREFLVERAPSLQVLVDAPALDATRHYGLENVPAFFLIGPDGVVLETLVGWDRERFNGLSRRAASALGKTYVELVAETDGPAYRPG